MPKRPPSARPIRPAAVHDVAALLLLATVALAGCAAEPDTPREPAAPPVAPASDPVERAADAELRSLLDGERLVDLVREAGLERLDAPQRKLVDAWIEEVRAQAPAPPSLRYRLDPERFDAATRTWAVDVKIPSLQQALDAPECRLALVLEQRPGESGPDARYRIAEARLALR